MIRNASLHLSSEHVLVTCMFSKSPMSWVGDWHRLLGPEPYVAKVGEALLEALAASRAVGWLDPSAAGRQYGLLGFGLEDEASAAGVAMVTVRQREDSWSVSGLVNLGPGRRWGGQKETKVEGSGPLSAQELGEVALRVLATTVGLSRWQPVRATDPGASAGGGDDESGEVLAALGNGSVAVTEHERGVVVESLTRVGGPAMDTPNEWVRGLGASPAAEVLGARGEAGLVEAGARREAKPNAPFYVPWQRHRRRARRVTCRLTREGVLP